MIMGFNAEEDHVALKEDMKTLVRAVVSDLALPYRVQHIFEPQGTAESVREAAQTPSDDSLDDTTIACFKALSEETGNAASSMVARKNSPSESSRAVPKYQPTRTRVGIV